MEYRRSFLKNIGKGIAGGLVGLVLGALPLNADNIKLKQGKQEVKNSAQESNKKIRQFEFYDAGEYETKSENFYEDRIPNYEKHVPKLRRLREINKTRLDDKIIEAADKTYCRKYDLVLNPRVHDSWEIGNSDYILDSRIFKRINEKGNSVGDLGLVVIKQPSVTSNKENRLENIDVYVLRPSGINGKYGGENFDALANNKGQIFVVETGSYERKLGNYIVVFNPKKDGSYGSIPDAYISLDRKFEPHEAGAVRVYGSEHNSKQNLEYIDGILLNYNGKEKRLLGIEEKNGKLPLYRLKQKKKVEKAEKNQDNRNKLKGEYKSPW
jgi:hypothetical protein